MRDNYRIKLKRPLLISKGSGYFVDDLVHNFLLVAKKNSLLVMSVDQIMIIIDALARPRRRPC